MATNCYYSYLENTPLTMDEVKERVSPEFIIHSIREEAYPDDPFKSAPVIGHSIHLCVRVDPMTPGRMTPEQERIIQTLGEDTQCSGYRLVSSEDEIRLKSIKSQQEWEAYMRIAYPNARYYLCHFRQAPKGAFGTGGEITVRTVADQTFSCDEYELAKKRAEEIEQEHYHRKIPDYNLQIVARFAESKDQALKGIFLDEYI